MIVFDWSDTACRNEALARPHGRRDEVLMANVRRTIDDVRRDGWDGLVRIAKEVDRSRPTLLNVAPFAAQARGVIPGAAQEAMLKAAVQIEAFHQRTIPQSVEVETAPGLRVAKVWRPVDRVGLYVPGGRSPLFSTLMMLAIPARVAGVGEMVVMTPPRPDGGLDLAIALAANICGIETIWTIGGAQAIAAMAYGAGDIAAVDRICGPGNAWVTAAKTVVASTSGGPAIDLPAGPSELMIVSGVRGNAVTIAADLLSQAEHDREAQVILVSPSNAIIEEVARQFRGQAATLTGDHAPLRSIRCRDLDEAVGIANIYAPEHLSLACDESAAKVDSVRHAGAVFVGSCAAESFADYMSGSSHVLPTDGAARFTGGVSTLTFMKAMTVQRVSPRAAAAMAAPVAAMARLEGLEAHARAAEARADR